MKYKVTIGTLRHNADVVEAGNFIELADKYAKPLLASGVIEAVVEKKVEKEVKVEVVKEEVKPEVVEETIVAKAEPSIDWTRAELDEYALSVGVKEPEKAGSKAKLLKLILKK